VNRIELRDVTRRSDSRIRNQNVYRPKLRANTISRSSHRIRVANIRGNRKRLLSTQSNYIDDLVEEVLTPSYQTKTRTARSNGERQTFPDPGRGPGDHDGLVCPETRIIGHISFDISHLSFPNDAGAG
jgi:hypothetical protein